MTDMEKTRVALQFFNWLIDHDSVVKAEFSCYNIWGIVDDFVKETK